ncbi:MULTISPECIES: 3'-5' exonuclease [unclassified Pseudomonas]|jgi:DNA polymerase III subunit epsilon|uniref:3'-5' exonuclease n=1 Tax=unclassified Pseudomonas TaxID=196821 RepID=UPI000C33AF3D|nr:3'-5' exonuclease [Pseudomonas sp. 43NM1]
MSAVKVNRQFEKIDWAARFQVLAEEVSHPHLKKFYQAGAVPAHTLIEHVQLLAMDIETTGLDAESHSIVSIGLIPFTLQRIYCGQALYWVIQPPSELNDQSVTFHHITHSDILDAPGLSEIVGELLEAMAGKVMVVHYRNIERGFLDQALRLLLGEGVQFPVIDTMQLEARMHRQKRTWLDRLLRRPRRSIRLADSRARYNLPAYHAHHALTDALAAAELLQAQIANHYSPSTPIEALWN